LTLDCEFGKTYDRERVGAETPILFYYCGIVREGFGMLEIEINYIRDNYYTKKIYEIAEDLGVHEKTIDRYAKKLGLRKKFDWTIEEIECYDK
jgi:hypothetical protein